MSNEAFADLKKALEDAVAFERGQRRDLKRTRIQAVRLSVVSVQTSLHIVSRSISRQ